MSSYKFVGYSFKPKKEKRKRSNYELDLLAFIRPCLSILGVYYYSDLFVEMIRKQWIYTILYLFSPLWALIYPQSLSMGTDSGELLLKRAFLFGLRCCSSWL